MTTFNRVSDSDALAGDATNITINELGSFSLTAVKTGAGNLKLINWRTGNTVARVSDSGNQAGEVSGIAVTRNLNRTVTAVRNGSGNLNLSPGTMEAVRAISPALPTAVTKPAPLVGLLFSRFLERIRLQTSSRRLRRARTLSN